MPRFDRTGPCGNGPNTGRGLGPCVDDGASIIKRMRNGGGRRNRNGQNR